MQQTAYDLLYGRMTEGAASKKQGNKTGSRNMNCSREAEECFRKKKKKRILAYGSDNRVSLTRDGFKF